MSRHPTQDPTISGTAAKEFGPKFGAGEIKHYGRKVENSFPLQSQSQLHLHPKLGFLVCKGRERLSLGEVASFKETFEDTHSRKVT